MDDKDMLDFWADRAQDSELTSNVRGATDKASEIKKAKESGEAIDKKPFSPKEIAGKYGKDTKIAKAVEKAHRQNERRKKRRALQRKRNERIKMNQERFEERTEKNNQLQNRIYDSQKKLKDNKEELQELDVMYDTYRKQLIGMKNVKSNDKEKKRISREAKRIAVRRANIIKQNEKLAPSIVKNEARLKLNRVNIGLDGEGTRRFFEFQDLTRKAKQKNAKLEKMGLSGVVILDTQSFKTIDENRQKDILDVLRDYTRNNSKRYFDRLSRDVGNARFELQGLATGVNNEIKDVEFDIVADRRGMTLVAEIQQLRQYKKDVDLNYKFDNVFKLRSRIEYLSNANMIFSAYKNDMLDIMTVASNQIAGSINEWAGWVLDHFEEVFGTEWHYDSDGLGASKGFLMAMKKLRDSIDMFRDEDDLAKNGATNIADFIQNQNYTDALDNGNIELVDLENDGVY